MAANPAQPRFPVIFQQMVYNNFVLPERYVFILAFDMVAGSPSSVGPH